MAEISHPCAHDGNDVWSRTKKGGRMGQREEVDEGGGTALPRRWRKRRELL